MLPLFAHSRHIAFPPVLVYSFGAIFGKITVIEPCYLTQGTETYARWEKACIEAESAYFDLLNAGCSPQEARAVLPNSLKTELVMTADIREWRHFLRLRCSKAAHPQIREVATQLLEALQWDLPVLFGDIWEDLKK